MTFTPPKTLPRRLLIATLILLLLIGALVAALPWIVRLAAPLVAPRLGLTELALVIGYPGVEQLRVRALKVGAERYLVQAENGVVHYQWRDLLAGRLDTVTFQSVSVALRSPSATAATGAPPLAPNLRMLAGELEPGALFALLPFREGRVQHLEVAQPETGFVAEGGADYAAGSLSVRLAGRAPELAERFRVELGLSADGYLDARIFDVLTTGAVAAPPVLELRSDRRAGGLGLAANLNLDGAALALASELAGWPAGAGVLAGSLVTLVPWPLPPALDWRALDATGTFRVDWQGATLPVTLTGISGEFELKAGSVATRLSGAATAQWGDYRLTAELPEGYPVVVADGGINAGGGVRLLLTEPGSRSGLRASGQLAELTARLAPELAGTVALTLDLHSSAGVAAGRVQARVAADGPGGVRGDFDFAGAVGDGQLTLPLAVTAEVSRRDAQVRASGRFDSGPLQQVPFRVEHDLATAVGTLDIEHRLLVAEPLLKALLPGQRRPFDLDAGDLGLRLAARWARSPSAASGWRLAAEAAVELGKGSAHYGDYRLTGLTTTLPLRLRDAQWRLAPSEIRAAVVDAGIVLVNARAGLSWQGDEVSVSGADAGLLGGMARTGAFVYGINAGRANLEVALEDLDLSKLLALEGTSVTGTGTLNGRLPIRLEANEASISGGFVAAQPPGGVLRLSAEYAGLTRQPGLDFALQALTDFAYTSLEADVEYLAAGDMALAVRLQGRNAAVEGGRPIHYNLNVTENLPVLLESLQLQSRVTERIERQFRK